MPLYEYVCQDCHNEFNHHEFVELEVERQFASKWLGNRDVAVRALGGHELRQVEVVGVLDVAENMIWIERVLRSACTVAAMFGVLRGVLMLGFYGHMGNVNLRCNWKRRFGQKIVSRPATSPGRVLPCKT